MLGLCSGFRVRCSEEAAARFREQRTTKYDRVVGLAPPNVSVHDDWAREIRWYLKGASVMKNRGTVYVDSCGV